MAERPKSSTAQIAQACTSVGLLCLAAFGYVYTVQPVYTRQRAEEAAARLEKEAGEYRAEIERNKMDLVQYEKITRRYVIEQFSARILAIAGNMYGFFGVGYYGLDYFGKSRPLNPYTTRLFDVSLIVAGKSLFSSGNTGADIIRQSINGDEFELLKEEPRQHIIEILNDAIERDPAFSQALGYQGDTQFPIRSNTFSNTWLSLGPMSPEERDEFNSRQRTEMKRVDAAHAAFVSAVKRLQTSLLNSP